MTVEPRRPPAGLGFAAIVLLTLSPIVLHGLWRPVAQALHADADALRLTGAALAVGAASWLAFVAAWGRGAVRWAPGASGAVVALTLAPLLGRGGASVVAAALGLLGVALASAALLPWMLPRLPDELDALARRHKARAALVVLLGVATVSQTARLSTFMGDARRPELSALPTMTFLVRHACMTAYVHAARLAAAGEANLYDARHWPDLGGSPRATAEQARYAPFQLDSFAYPPPFLLLPRLVLSPLRDFAAQRAVWFALNGLLLAAGLWVVSGYVSARSRPRALILALLVWISLPTIITLQTGNVHAAVIVLAMLAMVAVESGRPALGGAMLSFAILSKVSPALLVVVLLGQRRFRAVLWTAGFGLGFVMLSAAVFGVTPLRAFVRDELPLLGSGEALRFLALPHNVPLNMAPFGVPFKLDALGLDVGDPWRLARHINRVFTVVVLALTALAARRSGGPGVRAGLWLTVLALGTLRSPFAPTYTTFPLLWLFALWLAEVRGAASTAIIAATWALLSVARPLAPRHMLIVSMVQQCLFLGFLLHGVLRRPPPEAASPDA
jgi:hypothetical protein